MSRVTIAKRVDSVKKRISGICADAVTLGVTRQHLHAVLTGRRRSQELTARYHRLKSK